MYIIGTMRTFGGRLFGGTYDGGGAYRTHVRLPGAQSFPPDFRMYGVITGGSRGNRQLKLFSAKFSEVPVRLTST